KLCGADSADVTERGRACVVRGLCSYRSPDSSRTVVDYRGSAKGGVLGTKRRWRAQVHKTSVGDISGVTACCWCCVILTSLQGSRGTFCSAPGLLVVWR